MSGTDDVVEQILTRYATITVVEASAPSTKAAHSVPGHMRQRGWRIIPVNPHATQILGEHMYHHVADIPEQVGLVDVSGAHRRRLTSPAKRLPSARQPSGSSSASHQTRPRAISQDAGLLYVEDRCLIIEQRRLGLDAPRML